MTKIPDNPHDAFRAGALAGLLEFFREGKSAEETQQRTEKHYINHQLTAAPPPESDIDQQDYPEIRNGFLWISPSFLIAETVWLQDDQWILLGVPAKATHGETCRNAFSLMVDGAKGVIMTEFQLKSALHDRGWKRLYRTENQVLSETGTPFTTTEEPVRFLKVGDEILCLCGGTFNENPIADWQEKWQCSQCGRRIKR